MRITNIVINDTYQGYLSIIAIDRIRKKKEFKQLIKREFNLLLAHEQVIHLIS